MKKAFLILTAALTMSAAVAEAQQYPGNPLPPPGYGPGHGGPGYGPGRGPGYPPGPGYGSITIPVYADRVMYDNDHINIGQFVNLYQYRGYRITSIDFTASSQFRSAWLDVLVNGYQMAPTINLNPYANNFRIFPNQNLYIGHGGENITLYSRGPVNIRNIFLQLSR